MDQLMQDIRFAARSLMKTPLVSALCVLCLAVGIGLNSNIYGAVFMAFQRPLPYASPERLVTVRERQIKTGQLGGIGYQKFFDLSQKSSAFEQMGATTFRSISITDGEEPIRLQGEMVSWTLFPMLG